jgi:glycopeptide antibiotics resistance protein
MDLNIPESYTVLNKTVLEPFWQEFEMSWEYWDAVLKNIIGFVPLGFCFCAYLATLMPMKRAMWLTVALGALVSLTIEILQAFLPTRDSGTTDIITNTLGTGIGAVVYRIFVTALARCQLWSSVSIESSGPQSAGTPHSGSEASGVDGGLKEQQFRRF